MKAISKTIDQAANHYDVIVIGSGYGGGVAASRSARAGKSVCLLERGREILPPDFPNSISTAQNEFQLNTAVSAEPLGNAKGLYDLKVNDDMNALVGCGLGGTSLINANVSLEFDEKIFNQQSWPERYRSGELLKPHYKMAKKMLGANPYPRDDLNKLKALQVSAKSMGVECYKPPINVTFSDQINSFGVEQKACNNCGDCCSGCNVTAKNTTQMNYLPDATNHGADIICEARVETLSKGESDSWVVHITDLSGVEPRVTTLHADKVIVSAGTFGSTQILLRSAAAGMNLSNQLGERFSGNGDVLAFGYNNYWDTKATDDNLTPIYGVGIGSNDVSLEAYPGPCITGVIDNRATAPIEDSRVIEEGVIPGALAMALPPAFFFAGAQYANFLHYGVTQAGMRLKDAVKLGSVITDDPSHLGSQAYTGPVSRTQTYLIMSYDDSGGKMSLDDNGNIRVAWKNVGRSRCILDDNSALKAATIGVQGQFVPNPMWTEPMNYKLITVHPLGGCPMGDNVKTGVVNPDCEVYDGSGGLHEGLYVMDGSVIPTAGAVNPLLTITAVSEHAMQQIAAKHKWQIDYALEDVKPITIADSPTDREKSAKYESKPNSPHSIEAGDKLEKHHSWGEIGKQVRKLKSVLDDGKMDAAKSIMRGLVKEFPDFFSPGVSFSETMRGFLTEKLDTSDAPKAARISSDYDLAFAQGESDSTHIHYDLTIAAENLNKFTEKHRAGITGTVHCKLFSEHPLKVTNGVFRLFNPDPEAVETWTMEYRLNLQGEKGPMYFEGTKYLHQKSGSHWWNDVTTLFVDVYSGDDNTGKRLARGIMTLSINDAIQMAQTLKTPLQKHKDHLIEHQMAKLLATLVKKYPAAESTLDTLYVAKFGGFVAETVFKAYGGLLSDLKNFPHVENQHSRGHRRELNLPNPEIIQLSTSDGAKIKLYRYKHGHHHARKQVVLAPGFSVTANSFATNTVDTNLVEYLFHAGNDNFNDTQGYDVWLFAYRASPDSGNETTDYTIDDIVKKDWPLAIKHILEASGAPDVQAIVHCVGSMSLLMSILDGLQGIRSVISSQLTLHPVTNWLNFLKADVGLVNILEHGLGENMPDLSKTIPLRSRADDPDQKIAEQSAKVDIVCWQVPVASGEQCHNPVCHRVTSIFGPSYTHDQLNHQTHIAMEEWFDTIAVKPFEQLTTIIEKQIAVDANGTDSYLPNVEKLKLPIHFIAGGCNKIFLPETSLRTFTWLKAHNEVDNGEKYYSRHVFEPYAHMDLFIGKTAATDVFPHLLDELKKAAD
ncbi:MAG: GMC family oxidoreductase [Halioglobus sp.]